MSIFKPKKKLADVETEMSLPQYKIDPNGFILFDDRNLGGTAVLEVIPRVSTESFTLEDPYDHSQKTTEIGYVSYIGQEFGNSRDRILKAWVSFLNSLHAPSDSDDSIHVQIIAKKSTPPKKRNTGEQYYNTRLEYAIYQAHLDEKAQRKKLSATKKHDAFISARRLNYVKMLDALNNQNSLQYGKHIHNRLPIEIRQLPAYSTRYFIVVSYTPSSEGWWMDGRDSDYYRNDSSSPIALFRDDQLVDKVTNFALERIRRKSGEETTAGDFFYLEEDRIAQILMTRYNHIYEFAKEWDKAAAGEETSKNIEWGRGCTPDMMLPFEIKKLDGKEVAALIKFFPDILTPYWNSIWDLQNDTDDIIYRIGAQTAIATGDTSFFDMPSLSDKDNVEITKKHEEFIAQFKDKSLSEVASVVDEYDDELEWTPEFDIPKELSSADSSDNVDMVDLWGAIVDESILMDNGTGEQTRKQKRDEFKSKYKNKKVSSNVVKRK